VTGSAALVNGNPVPLWAYHFYAKALQQQYAGQPGISAKTIADEAMTQVVGDELVREYSVARGLVATQAAVNARVASDEKLFHGKPGLVKRLRALGLTFDEYLLLTAAGLERHNVAQRVAPIEYAHARHILIGTSLHKPPRTDAAARALAQSILHQVLHGGSFAGLARRYSDDPSGKKGGDLGSFCPGRMVPEFDRASFTVPLNHSVLVHSQFGYHILEVLSRAPATSKECPAQQLANPEQATAFIAWIHVQIAHARVKRLVAG
jgi:parvulin-like peptidyl-prolyl isomerase